MYCRNCGASIEENATVCMSCGVKAGDGNKYCPNCGAEPDPKAVICVKCGVSLEEDKVKKAFQDIKSGAKTVAHEVKDEAKTVAQDVKNEATSEVKVVRSIKDAFKVGVKKVVNFKDRANKAEFWWIYLICYVLSFVLTFTVIGSPLALALNVPVLSAMVRRLHDVGEKGTYALLGLIPIAGPIILLIKLLKPSQEGDNEYGPNPNIE